MPELPDVTVWVESLAAKVAGDQVERVRIASPFVLRTAVPPIAAVEGRRVAGVERLGKRVVVALEGDLFVAIHPMLAGRLHWHAAGAKVPARGAGLSCQTSMAGVCEWTVPSGWSTRNRMDTWHWPSAAGLQPLKITNALMGWPTATLCAVLKSTVADGAAQALNSACSSATRTSCAPKAATRR